MHKVMVPVDGSHCSENAARFLVDCMQKVSDLEIHLLNVQAEPEGWEVKRFLREDELADMAMLYGQAAIAPIGAILDRAGIPYSVHIERGPVAETIVALTEKLGCDQVFMGSHGRSAFADLLLGSVATKVLHQVKVPVTFVK